MGAADLCDHEDLLKEKEGAQRQGGYWPLQGWCAGSDSQALHSIRGGGIGKRA